MKTINPALSAKKRAKHAAPENVILKRIIFAVILSAGIVTCISLATFAQAQGPTATLTPRCATLIANDFSYEPPAAEPEPEADAEPAPEPTYEPVTQEPAYTEPVVYEQPAAAAPAATGGVVNGNVDGVIHDPNAFASDGVYKDSSGILYTYYSEKVLPGKGLPIPGRTSDGDYVLDGEGNVCLASSDYPKGTIVDVPFGNGQGVVYDTGCASGVIDVYVSF